MEFADSTRSHPPEVRAALQTCLAKAGRQLLDAQRKARAKGYQPRKWTVQELACISAAVEAALCANVRETVDPLEFSVEGGEAKGA
jgi:hypothetical protein